MAANIIKRTFGNGPTHVLYDWDILDDATAEKVCGELGITLHVFDIQRVLPHLERNFLGFVTPDLLERSQKKAEVKNYRDDLLETVRAVGASHVHVCSYLLPRSTLDEIRALCATVSTRVTDDPERSKWYSEPYVKNFDRAICSGVMFDHATTIEDAWRRWGAKNVARIPTYPNPRHYDDSPIDYGAKDIDVVFVGAANIPRMRRLAALKAGLGDALKLYGNYGNGDWRSIKGIAYKLLNFGFKIGHVENLSAEGLKSVYRRAKIGINLHITDYMGPSNVRSYELPLNGVMQLADNPAGYPALYDVGKEVVCFENVAQAVELARHYLARDEERVAIAKAGHARARKDYTYENILRQTLAYAVFGRKHA